MEKRRNEATQLQNGRGGCHSTVSQPVVGRCLQAQVSRTLRGGGLLIVSLLLTAAATGQQTDPPVSSPDGTIRIPLAGERNSTVAPTREPVHASSIDELPQGIREIFDRAYEELQDSRKAYTELQATLRDGDPLFAEATRRLESTIPAESAQIRRELRELPDDWNNIVRTKDSERQQWLLALHKTQVAGMYESLAADESFRPLLAWWAELVFTRDDLAAWKMEEDSEGLLTEASPSREQYLDAYLTMWRRHTDRHQDGLAETQATLSIPPSVPGLLERYFANSAEHQICSTVKRLKPQTELDAAADRIRRASAECTAVWPEWTAYHEQQEAAVLAAAAQEASRQPPQSLNPSTPTGQLESSSRRTIILAANAVILVALVMGIALSRRKKTPQ